MVELPDKSEQFIDWYLEAVEVAGLTDKRYPVKGMNVWTPYGFQAYYGVPAQGSYAVTPYAGTYSYAPSYGYSTYTPNYGYSNYYAPNYGYSSYYP